MLLIFSRWNKQNVSWWLTVLHMYSIALTTNVWQLRGSGAKFATEIHSTVEFHHCNLLNSNHTHTQMYCIPKRNKRREVNLEGNHSQWVWHSDLCLLQPNPVGELCANSFIAITNSTRSVHVDGLLQVVSSQLLAPIDAGCPLKEMSWHRELEVVRVEQAGDRWAEQGDVRGMEEGRSGPVEAHAESWAPSQAFTEQNGLVPAIELAQVQVALQQLLGLTLKATNVPLPWRNLQQPNVLHSMQWKPPVAFLRGEGGMLCLAGAYVMWPIRLASRAIHGLKTRFRCFTLVAVNGNGGEGEVPHYMGAQASCKT